MIVVMPVVMVLPVVVVAAVIMAVVVIMPVKRQCPLGTGAEQGAILGGRGHDLGGALAADMAIEANHPVRRAHDNVQFMADHQYRAAKTGTHILDLAVEGRRSGLIKTLRRLVQQQQIGSGQQRARQKHALKLPA